ncbi:carbohydrate-binding protein [Rhizobium sp. RU36D]|uniref:carbohydrate-binding protein n=1 Tax=Rhizobium sp. RU36D TaxID=1907415 RepID=UPI0009D7AFE6|nr:carbohydrate-binding protein [Rhizobium sp. RU36D]SMD01226.1 hypothetical protein SAMN05880593_11529 [Rhizobium sp. RU36D]
MELTLKIVDGSGNVRSQQQGADEVVLVYRAEYAEGDCIALETDGDAKFVLLCLDEAMPQALVYLKGGRAFIPIPFGPKRKPYSPKAFTGSLHRLSARLARPEEVAARRNLALNPYDDHANGALYPHAHANVETRGEAAFAARNAIDGETANDDHGFWPYTSWGINQDPNAALVIEFGRPVRIDEIALYLRADFPHDAWWERASLTLSDGQTFDVPLTKSAHAQRFAIEPVVIDWVRLHSLIKADDPSPFPALTQIEVWGTEA